MPKSTTKPAAPSVASSATELIAQIEKELGLSAGTLLCPGTQNDEHNHILADMSEMIDVFVQIPNRDMRRGCIELVRTAYKMTIST